MGNFMYDDRPVPPQQQPQFLEILRQLLAGMGRGALGTGSGLATGRGQSLFQPGAFGQVGRSPGTVPPLGQVSLNPYQPRQAMLPAGAGTRENPEDLPLLLRILSQRRAA